MAINFAKNIKNRLFKNRDEQNNESQPKTSQDLAPFEEIGHTVLENQDEIAGLGATLLALHQTQQLKNAGQHLLTSVRPQDFIGPVKQVAKMSARSGVAGGAVDAAIGGFNAAKCLYSGEITPKQAAIHTASEGVCGFLTAGAGTAGSISAFMLTGSLGPIVLAAGMASSVGTRWVYRSVVGETLVTQSEKKAREDHLEDIGPKK